MPAGRGGAQEALTLFGAAPRPDDGNKQGRPLQVTTNLFRAHINCRALENIQQLDVKIEPIEDPSAARRPGAGPRRESLPVRLNIEVLQHGLRTAAQQQLQGITDQFANFIVYDGRAIAYTAFALPAEAIEFETELPPKADLPAVPGAPGAASAPPRRAPGAAPAAASAPATAPRSDRRFRIKLAFARNIDIGLVLDSCRGDRRAIMATAANPQELVQDGIQAIDILLRMGLKARYQSGTTTNAARKFYDPTKPIHISQGAQIWPGFFQSARPCAAGLVVNLDPAYSAFVGGGPFIEV
ncbi:hypothetical protein PANT_18d00075, partial [Moesziomyces antarcticus T-34]